MILKGPRSRPKKGAQGKSAGPKARPKKGAQGKIEKKKPGKNPPKKMKQKNSPRPPDSADRSVSSRRYGRNSGFGLKVPRGPQTDQNRPKNPKIHPNPGGDPEAPISLAGFYVIRFLFQYVREHEHVDPNASPQLELERCSTHCK